MASDFLDLYDLYERCVQHPGVLTEFLVRSHGGEPRVLREDFCGSAALCRAWVKSCANREALGVDLDPAAIDAACERCARLEGMCASRVRLVQADAAEAAPAGTMPPDVIFVGNFSLGEIRTRAELMRYLRLGRERLARGGIFAADTFGGAGVYRRGFRRRIVDATGGTRIHCVWEQGSLDPFSAMIRCAVHFRIEEGGEVTRELPDAFVYEWRLWSVAELRDALDEAGFGRVDVCADLVGAGVVPGESAAERDEESGEGHTVCLIARV